MSSCLQGQKEHPEADRGHLPRSRCQQTARPAQVQGHPTPAGATPTCSPSIPAPGHRPHQPPPNSKQPPASPPVWARKLRGQGLTDQPGLPSVPSTSVLRLSQAWNLGDSQAGAKSPPVSTQHPAQDDVCSQACSLEACFPPLCTGGNDDPAHRGLGGCT